jgi:hypothetical protein
MANPKGAANRFEYHSQKAVSLRALVRHDPAQAVKTDALREAMNPDVWEEDAQAACNQMMIALTNLGIAGVDGRGDIYGSTEALNILLDPSYSLVPVSIDWSVYWDHFGIEETV